MNEWTKMSSVSVREQQHMMHVMALNYQTKKKANDGTKQTYLPADSRQTDTQTDRQNNWAVYVIHIHTSQQLLRQFKWSYSQKMILTFDLQWPWPQVESLKI